MRSNIEESKKGYADGVFFFFFFGTRRRTIVKIIDRSVVPRARNVPASHENQRQSSRQSKMLTSFLHGRMDDNLK